MRKVMRFGAAAIFAGAAALVVGCGDSNLGTVHGTVTYEGAPIEKGSIDFLPADGKGASVGAEIVAGAYSAEGVPPGPKIVQVIAVKDVPFARSSEEMAQRAAEQAKSGNATGLIDPADVIPPDAVGNNQQHEIASGDQTLDIALTKPGA